LEEVALKGLMFTIRKRMIRTVTGLALVLPAVSGAEVKKTHVTGSLRNANGTVLVGKVTFAWSEYVDRKNTQIAVHSVDMGLIGTEFDGYLPRATEVRANFELDDGTRRSELWCVPDKSSATVDQIRCRQ
jgi:hypothetical protein